MAKHTPAPWKTGDCDNCIIWAPRFASTEWVNKGNTIGEPEAVSIAVVECPPWAMGGLDPDERAAWLAETEANAKLIAAAPEMAAALIEAEACMSIVQPRSDTAEYLRILGVVRAALVKAGVEK